jgi:phospholipid/cholesterol/gamma-HCH transport system permease protein
MRKLVAPRIIALVIMVPALTVVCDFIGLLGGWIVAVFISNLTSTTYISAVKERLIFGNIFIGLVKPVLFSFIIAFIACYKGFASEGGTKGVGRATTESVMLASITVLVSNFFITKVIWSFLKGYL